MLGGLILLCMGIALLAKSGLGASPISSIPYSLSLIAPRLSLVAGQIILLRNKPGSFIGRAGGKALPWHEVVIQLIIAVITGYLVDLSLFLYRVLPLTSYPRQLLASLIASWLMGTGIYIQLRANVAMAPGDAFSRALSAVAGRPYGKVRVIADCAMVTVSLILCMIFLHRPGGVREGTLICCLLTGNIIKLYQKKLG